MTEFFHALFVIRDLLCNQIPKLLPMIELRKMTKFMHDQIILKASRQKEDLIAKVKILKRGARSPRTALIAYRDTLIGEAIMRVPFRKFCMDQHPGFFLIGQIVFSNRASSLWSSTY
jgi:hypothetical protein